MNLIKNPALLDRLASSYALGTLRGGARRRFEALAREQAPVRAAALMWQTRIASLNELQPPCAPSPAVWTRIDNLLQGQLAQQAKLQSTPQIEYVAVLADDKSAASMLVTFDATHKKLILQRVSGFQEPGDRSLQLWALPPAGGPKSLGVLGSDKVLRLTAAEGDVREVPTLAISLEPKGGVPSAGGPTGPVLFKGALIQTVL